MSDDLAPGTYVCLEVQDTGCGMEESMLARIFDPFFTTKFMGRGLGLAAVLGVVRGHGGAIRIRTAPGAGSTFTVLLPAVKEPPPPPRPARELSHAERTVLVVDDEEVVRHTARAILERFGYRVLLAENGEEALAVFGKMANQVSLVVLDIAMPAMSGVEALQHLRRIRPDVQVLVATGFDEQETARRFEGSGPVEFIAKPYTSRQLADRIQEILNR
ncbi:MAG: response regulator [Acidobacteria bacterium]|nr:response regulator [Acidobacteriota bacterium]